MERIRSQSTQFFDRLTHVQFLLTRLWVICIILGIFCLMLLGALLQMFMKPKAIYYVPGAWQAGIAQPSMNTKAAVGDFVVSWILNWNNFNPVTATEVYTRAQRSMSPLLLSKTKSRLDKDLLEIQQSRISSMFTMREDPLIEIQKKGFDVELKGTRVLYIGKEIVKEQNLTFKVYVRMVSQTENNPFGLLIEVIDQEINL